MKQSNPALLSMAQIIIIRGDTLCDLGSSNKILPFCRSDRGQVDDRGDGLRRGQRQLPGARADARDAGGEPARRRRHLAGVALWRPLQPRRPPTQGLLQGRLQRLALPLGESIGSR